MSGKMLGPYRLDAELGSGAMGKVWRATGPSGTVAVKVVHPHLLESPGFFKRFLREAELGKSVVHPNVVRTLDVDAISIEGTQQNFLVMEYVEGQTLRGLLDELARVPEELCRHIGREMAKGLSAIHAAGAIHRDLKPENVLITRDHAVKIMDLGVARLADEALRLSRSGAFVGSVQYASPEQFAEGAEAVDGRSDLWSLGVILYELSCGEHPFPGDSFGAVLSKVVTEEPRRLGERNPQLSAFFEELVHTLLSKDRAKRFASAAEFFAILEECEKSAWWADRAKAIRAATKRPLRRIRIPRETAVYGRDAELAKLRELYDAAKAGDGRVVLIEGEAGIGKTRLVDEFVGRLRSLGEDVNFLFGSYPPGGAATASGAWSTAYREQFGAEDLEETLKDYLTVTPILIPAFAALLRGEPAPKDTEPLTKDSIHTVFVHATRALAAERPTIVLIEDLHFAPEEGRGMFAALALAVPDHRILLIGTSRPGLPEAWRAGVERLEQASRVELARLGPKDLTRLLIDAFHSERLAEELGFKIAQKSDGNPFFVFEIIRGLREGQFIARRDDGTWVTTKVIRDLEVPSSVLDLVKARIADLEPEGRELLDVASCCGFSFDPTLVAMAAGQQRLAALKKFGQIERRHHLVRSVGREFLFDHHQIQDALYGSMNDQLREEYHGALGDALERLCGADKSEPQEIDGSLLVELAQHLLKGARGVQARRYLNAALDYLQREYLRDPAVALADQALNTPGLLAGAPRAEVLLRKAVQLGFCADRRGERAALDEALALADRAGDPGLRARVRSRLGTHLSRGASLAHAMTCLREARELARTAGDPKTEGEVEGTMSLILYSSGRPLEATEHMERALALARAAGNRLGEASATGNLGVLHGFRGQYADARESYARCLDLARQAGDRSLEGIATGNLGVVHLVLGRLAEAFEFTERALIRAREIAARRLEGRLLLHRGEVAAEQDRLPDAETAYREAVTLLADNAKDVVGCRVALGDLLARAGRTGEARQLLAEAHAAARESDYPEENVLALAHLATFPGAESIPAEDALVRHEARLAVSTRMEARLLLFRATGDRAHLAEAKRLLDFAVEHSPEDCRESMLQNVRLHREIAAAAKEAGLR